MQEYKGINDLPAVLNVKHISNYLGLSRGNTYNLLRAEGFPTLRIGKRMMVPKEVFIKWVELNIGKPEEVRGCQKCEQSKAASEN